MVSFRKSVEIAAPVHVVYEQWRRFEEFPKFIPGILSVDRFGENRFRWESSLLGHVLEWEGEICEDVPDQRMAWRSIAGASNSGTATFEPLSMERTLLTLGVTYEAAGLLGQLGVMLGLVEARVEGHLLRFRDYVEERAELGRIGLRG